MLKSTCYRELLLIYEHNLVGNASNRVAYGSEGGEKFACKVHGKFFTLAFLTEILAILYYIISVYVHYKILVILLQEELYA